MLAGGGPGGARFGDEPVDRDAGELALPSGRCAAPYPAISALSARMLMRRGMPPAASAISQAALGDITWVISPAPLTRSRWSI